MYIDDEASTPFLPPLPPPLASTPFLHPLPPIELDGHDELPYIEGFQGFVLWKEFVSQDTPDVHLLRHHGRLKREHLT